MKVRYIGEEPSVLAFDHRFPHGEAVSVDHLHPAHRAKLDGNPQFETVHEKAAHTGEGHEPHREPSKAPKAAHASPRAPRKRKPAVKAH